MPSIRTEMRVSHKLSSEIVGPSLKIATEILHSAYSKRTKETQKVMRWKRGVAQSICVGFAVSMCCALFRHMNEHILLALRLHDRPADPC